MTARRLTGYGDTNANWNVYCPKRSYAVVEGLVNGFIRSLAILMAFIFAPAGRVPMADARAALRLRRLGSDHRTRGHGDGTDEEHQVPAAGQRCQSVRLLGRRLDLGPVVRIEYASHVASHTSSAALTLDSPTQSVWRSPASC